MTIMSSRFQDIGDWKFPEILRYNSTTSIAQVVIVVEPSGYQSYLTIQNQTVDLADLHRRDSRTCQMEIMISAVGVSAKEAVYPVKGLLFIEGNQSDVREFELRVRQ
jgi:hypothetical protein